VSSDFDIAAGWPRSNDERSKKNAVRDLVINHTLIVGQSRSGKSSAARRIAEEIFLNTSARIVVFDPNADFCLINETKNDLGTEKDFKPKWEALKDQIAITKSIEKNLDAITKDKKRMLVLDLSFDDEQVRILSAGKALELLWQSAWEQRGQYNKAISNGKTPDAWPGTIIVIDEAHVFAPQEPADNQRAVSDRIERIADQGKKLNLYLILITQQPNKLNHRILAECDNRIILRMNERLSLKILEETYGGHRGRYDGALTFPPSQGYALIEGALLSDTIPPEAQPRGITFKIGRTKEGGGSPAKDWI
jgi:DNA helicase HerA-like ATPase